MVYGIRRDSDDMDSIDEIDGTLRRFASRFDDFNLAVDLPHPSWGRVSITRHPCFPPVVSDIR